MNQNDIIFLLALMVLVAIAITAGIVWNLKRKNRVLRAIREREFLSPPLRSSSKTRYIASHRGTPMRVTGSTPTRVWDKLKLRLRTKESIDELKAQGYRVTLLRGK